MPKLDSIQLDSFNSTVIPLKSAHEGGTHKLLRTLKYPLKWRVSRTYL